MQFLSAPALPHIITHGQKKGKSDQKGEKGYGMPIVGRIGRDAGVSGVGGAGVCAQGARAARAGGVLAVDGSADAQGARAGSAEGGSIRKRGTPLRRLHLTTAYGGASPQGEALRGRTPLRRLRPSQFGIVVLQRCRLQNSLPHWRCIRLYLPQRRIARLIRAAIAVQPPLKGKPYGEERRCGGYTSSGSLHSPPSPPRGRLTGRNAVKRLTNDCEQEDGTCQN